MTITISTGLTEVEPDIVLGYTFARESRNVLHQPLASEWPAVTLKPAAVRKGTLTLVFRDRAAAVEAERMHALGVVFRYADSAFPEFTMSYVLAPGSTLALRQDDEVRTHWLLDVPYQRVAAA